jgi:aminomethyltransferase
MGQIQLIGDQSAAELEKLVPGDIQNLEPGKQRYTLLTNKSGGIIDDLIIANLGTHLLLIVNAARYRTALVQQWLVVPAMPIEPALIAS